MGHSTARAAIAYPHGSDEQQVIAGALSRAGGGTPAARNAGSGHATGTTSPDGFLSG